MILKKFLLTLIMHTTTFIFIEIVIYQSIFSLGDRAGGLIIKWVFTGVIFQISSLPIYSSNLFIERWRLLLVTTVSIFLYVFIVFYPFNFQDTLLEVKIAHLVRMLSLIAVCWLSHFYIRIKSS